MGPRYDLYAPGTLQCFHLDIVSTITIAAASPSSFTPVDKAEFCHSHSQSQSPPLGATSDGNPVSQHSTSNTLAPFDDSIEQRHGFGKVKFLYSKRSKRSNMHATNWQKFESGRTRTDNLRRIGKWTYVLNRKPMR